MKRPHEDGYLIEFYQMGGAVKVSALDPRTLEEVSVIADPRISQEQMAELAIRKLEFVLKKKLGKKLDTHE